MGHESVSPSSTLLKKRILAGAVAAATAGFIPVANADVELGEGLSVTGFVDQSFFYLDEDGAPSDKSYGIDQVETDFLYTGSNGVTARVDIEYGEDYSDLGGGDSTFVEQAYVTKSFNDMFSMKFGRFLSYSGWETEEPTGLFQYSGTGYAPSFYGYYQQGVSAYYDGGSFALMGSVVTDVFGYAAGPLESNTKDLGYELGVAVMPMEGLTAKLFYMSDKKTDRDVINFWASYAISGFTFAGEYNKADYGPGLDGDGFLLMANYATGPYGVTVRYHDFKDEFNVIEESAITLSPSYKVGDNLLLVAEVRKDNFKVGGADSTSFALEALFTF